MINVLKIDLDCFPETKKRMEFELEWDERKHKKECNSLQEKYQDFKEYVIANKVQHKYQSYIINNLLSHSVGVKVCDLKRKLHEEYYLDNHTINLILQHLLANNRFVQIDHCDQKMKGNLCYTYIQNKQNLCQSTRMLLKRESKYLQKIIMLLSDICSYVK